MENSWILFPSATYAGKAKSLFEQAGIRTKMERIPESVLGRTCGYRLLVTGEQVRRAVEICQNNRIRLIRIMPA